MNRGLTQPRPAPPARASGLSADGEELRGAALAHLVGSPGRYLDPFLLVVVYCALSFGETHGMLAGAAAGLSQAAATSAARARYFKERIGPL